MENNSKNLVKIIDAEKLLESLRKHKSENRYEEAIDDGLSALKLLGISIKVKPGMLVMLREIDRTKKIFTNRRIKKIPLLKAILSQKTQLQLTLLSELVEPSLKVNEDLWYVVLMWIARISMKKGNSEVSAIGYAGFAMISVRYLEDDRQAELLFNATMKLLEKQDDHRTSAIAKFILGAFVSHIYVSWIESLRILDEGAKDGFNGGEPIIGGLCLVYGIEMAFASGIALSDVQRRINSALELNKDNDSQEVKAVIDLYQKFIECVATDGCDDVLKFDLPLKKDASFHLPIHVSAVMLQIVLSYNNGRYEEALVHIKSIKEELNQLKVHFITGVLYGYEALSLTAIAPESSPLQRSGIKRRVRNLKSLFNYWVNRNPYNYGQMYKIIEASEAQLTGDFHKGEAAFEKAIELSEKNGALVENGMALVALARHCRLHEKEHMATYYIMEGARIFDIWNGKSISHKLLTNEKIHIPHEEVKARWQLSESDLHSDLTSRAMELTEQLTVKREDFLPDYCRLVTDTMHCDKVLVFLDDRGVLRPKAMSGVTYDHDTPCESMKDVSVKAIKQVFRNNESIVVNSDKGHELAKYDAYIMDHGTGCILSEPLSYNGSVIGVIYAERCDDFMEDDCAVVKRLTAHVAYLWVKGLSKYNIKRLPKLSTEEQEVFELVRLGKSIKEISDMKSTRLNQVLDTLALLYDKLDVENLYEMQTR